MTSRPLTPTKLRLILSITLILSLLVTSGVFYLAYQQLDKMAADVGKRVADANDSQSTLQRLQKLKQDLEADQDVIAKTALVAADGENYGYQDQIVSDLTAYASRSGMIISNITFSTAGTGTSAPAPGAPASPNDTAPSGLKKTTVSVTLKNPADYKGLLNFMHYIEQNLTKMKISNITLTKSGDGLVNTDILSLDIYLR